MGTLTSICVYCGSGAGADPVFSRAASMLGRAMAASGIRLVYGGGSVGLMGVVARAALDAGGAVTGVIPRFLLGREHRMNDLTETIITDDMHQRKMLMFERADAFVALPGGVGTLEELVEQITWAQLGQHRKPILVANIAGFWDPLLALLEAMQRQAFIRPGMEISCLLAERAEDILPILTEAAARRPEFELHQTAAGAIGHM